MNTRILKASLFTVIATSSSIASADPRDASAARMPAVTDAVEITVGGSYAYGAGDVGGTMDTTDISTPGGGGEVGIGYRVTPNLTVGGYGTINGFADHGTSRDAGTASAGINATWHVAPRSSTDPWVSLGAGVKWLWSGSTNELDRTLFGVELVNARLGVDYRISPSVALGPAVGVSVTTYTHEDVGARNSYETIDDHDVNLTMSAGLQGRFDLFGQKR